MQVNHQVIERHPAHKGTVAHANFKNPNPISHCAWLARPVQHFGEGFPIAILPLAVLATVVLPRPPVLPQSRFVSLHG